MRAEEMIIACTRLTEHGRPEQILQTIARVVEIEGYQSMNASALAKQICLKTHPDTMDGQPECKKKAYEALFKLTQNLKKLV